MDNRFADFEKNLNDSLGLISSRVYPLLPTYGVNASLNTEVNFRFNAILKGLPLGSEFYFFCYLGSSVQLTLSYTGSSGDDYSSYIVEMVSEMNIVSHQYYGTGSPLITDYPMYSTFFLGAFNLVTGNRMFVDNTHIFKTDSSSRGYILFKVRKVGI